MATTGFVTLSTDEFFYEPEGRKFIGEVSSMPQDFRARPNTWSDTGDYINLKSARTGDIKTFKFSKCERSAEVGGLRGVIIAFVYTPIDPQDQSGLRIVLFND